MVALHQGTSSSTANPVLLFICVVQAPQQGIARPPGFLVEPTEMSFRILDPTGAEAVAPTAVDLDASRVREGTFAPPITIGGAAALGEWTIEWSWEYEVGGEVLAYEQPTHFVVVSSAIPLVDGYAQVADARAEGVPTSVVNDARLAAALERASRTVEAFTRRFFNPRHYAYDYDAVGRGVMIRTRQPIIALDEVTANFADFTPSLRIFDYDGVRVYNRHMRGMLAPDDRQAPKIEVLRQDDVFSSGQHHDPWVARFTTAQQNVTITGWWGYTDPDGGPFGRTPWDIQRVTMMIAMRDVRPLWGSFGGSLTTGAIQSERTRDQAVTYASGSASSGSNASTRAPLTGDPTVDNILLRFRAPPVMASA